MPTPLDELRQRIVAKADKERRVRPAVAALMDTWLRILESNAASVTQDEVSYMENVLERM